MYKSTLELGNVNKIMKLKLSIIISSDDTTKNNYKNNLLQKFVYNGNKYFKIMPHPFITIDISKGNGGEWSISQTVNLNKISLFGFTSKLKKFLDIYVSEKDLFYYDEIDGVQKLVVDKEKSSLHAFNLRTTSNKTIRMVPCVVQSDDDSNTLYEGAIFCINSYDNFCYITYDEMQYLLHELNTIDINSLALQMISIVQANNQLKEDEIKMPTISREEEVIMNSRYVKIEKPNETEIQ